MKNSKIVLLTLDYPPECGGVAVYLSSLVKESDGGISVIVPEGHATDGPGEVVAKKLFCAGRVKWRPMVNVCRKIGGGKQLLVSHVFPVGTAAWLSKLVGGPEYSIIFHGLDLKLAAGRWKSWLLNRVCNGAKVLIANSEFTKKELLKLLKRRTDVIVITPAVEEGPYPSREEARRILNIGPDEQIVLTVARLIPRKGLDFSLRAMSRVQTYADVVYVVLGDGPDSARLEKVAEECRTKVKWIRDAKDNEKKLWLASADVFLLPAREEKFDVEGFGIVYLEAAKAGLPCVAGSSGGIKEAVVDRRTGLVVDADKISEIAHAVEKLLEDGDLRKTLGQAGRERVEDEFCWSDRWLKLAEKLGTVCSE
ncbi:glycosyltransferase family 4 protein [Patescibacteria group bacterium]|nr:glycosyltransferase family 4 protein [Patescibacteria group bacterium]MBU1034600.1 glycosyltransferase family 4 protein [Patescibacteria group bacterium]MBU1629637.1 glycosyltransferase family 4 protein [Patescibacteria group bacterium]MBU1908332.1 glycosyltransferase family 4 protein [Patescibacteria group bacterium]